MTNEEVHPVEVSEWEVSFPLVNKSVVRPTLFDWSQEEDEQLKYYSGHAQYKGSFVWKQTEGNVYLRLNKVANVATVFVNGVDCGVAWTSPYEVDITQALKEGENTLEISVVNTWANAFRGADKGKAPFEGIWANARYRIPGDVLLPAGSLGKIECVVKK